MKRLTVPVVLIFAIGCATGVADMSRPEAKATLSVTNVSPATGSALEKASVFAADVTYSIENFQIGVDYYVGPYFASGDGTTFSMVPGFSDMTKLVSPSGTVQIQYPVAQELESEQLARPVRIWLYVMERYATHKTRVIGMSGPYEYQ